MIRHLASIATSLWVRRASALLVAPTLVVAFACVRPDCMVIERVIVDGLNRAQPGALRHLADLPNGTTVWNLDLDRVVAGVERHPWVRSANARLEWPDTVFIDVEEYEPVALLHVDGRYHYVDREGTPFLADVTDDLDFPSITGIGPDLERAHPDLPRLAVRDALWLLDALEQRGLVPRDRVSEIAFSRTRGFTVHTRGARMVFGLDELDRQISRLELLVTEGKVDLTSPTWVDLAPATVAIVRPLSGPHAFSGTRRRP